MQLEKVRAFILKNRLLLKGDTVIVAVSGGPDSLCLLHILHQLLPEFDLKLVAAHLNHCLRPEAEQEAKAVEKISAKWSLPFETRAVDIRRFKKEHGVSEEEAGRLARYQFLFDMAGRHGASRIALGHQLDDQAETVLLNIIRGTGVDGLAGILPIRSWKSVKLVRPLLCLTRSEIEDYCRRNDLYPSLDSSNLETDYTRNKLRLELIPRLEEQYNPRIREVLSRLASLAAADRSFLQGLAQKMLVKIARSGRKHTALMRDELLSLPPALKSRVVRLALQRFVSLKKIGRRHIDQVLSLVENGTTGQGVSLPGGLVARMEYGRLVLFKESGREPAALEALPLKVPGKTYLPGGTVITAKIVDRNSLKWAPFSFRAYLDYDSIPDENLIVRSRRPGDRFYPQGASGSKKLKDFFIDRKVPFYRRDSVPLVTVGNEILWVAGLRVAHPYRVTEKTERVLQLEYRALKRSN